MNKIKSFIIVALALTLSVSSLTAQKYGYIDSQQLLVDHPAMQQADNEIKTLTDQLMARGETMVKDFEAAYQQLVSEAEQLAPVQVKERETKLAEQQQSIQQFETEMQQQIAVKRQELIEPILDKVKVAIETVGKDEGYTMIFDISTGMLLHADPSEDLLTKVKGKLGI
jgi:outer membrane protein